jgi:hypothetical protein
VTALLDFAERHMGFTGGVLFGLWFLGLAWIERRRP